MSAARPRLHYGWIVAAVTFCVLLAAAGVRATPGVLIVPLESAFGWSAGTISLAVAVNIALYGLMGPFSAALMDRLGIRATVAAFLGLIALGVALTAFMQTPWQLVLLWGVIVGVGTGMTAMVLAATVVNRWFFERRGLVMGILTASTATGQLIFLPILAAIVQSRGWRDVAFAVAAVAALMIVPVLLLMRERPRDVGLRAFGEPADAPRVAETARRNPIVVAFAGLARGARSRDFWLLFGSFFICGASTNGLIGTHLIPACSDHGIPEVRAAGLLAAMGCFDLVGTTLSGYLSDRWNNRYLLFWYYGLRGLSLLFLPAAFGLSFTGLSLFSVFYGLDWVATVPPTVRLTTDVFGKQDGPVIFGWIVAGHQLGAGAIALAAGLMRTAFSTYDLAFETSGILCVIAALMVLRIGVAARGRTRLAQATG